MVTNIAGLQIKNNINVIEKFSKRCALQYFGHTADETLMSFKNEQNCVKH